MQRPDSLDPTLAVALLDIVATSWPHGIDALFACLRVLVDHGVPVDYAENRFGLPHPILRRGRGVWTPEAGGKWLVETDVGQQEETAEERAYAGSPLRQGADSRRGNRIEGLDPDLLAHLERLDTSLEAPLQVVLEGFTDARLLTLEYGAPARGLYLFATRAQGGFSSEAVRALHAALWAFGAVARLGRWRGVAHVVATTYIGPVTGRRVLAGELRLGEVERRRAVVWFSDLRGFTAMSVSLAPEEVVRRINEMFEHVAGAIHDQGGEVLKLIGDAILAIFPYDDEAGAVDSTARALRAARASANLPLGLAIGIGLHRGEVAYGNVGAPDRLDFTVIGRTVNVASRIESVTSRLGKRVLASEEVAACAPSDFVPAGDHELKGIPGAVALFEFVG